MNINLFYVDSTSDAIVMKKKLLNVNENNFFINKISNVIKEEKFIIIKHFNDKMCKNIAKLKKRGNIVIYEPVDNNWNLNNIEDYINKMTIFNYVDKIILPSKYFVNLLLKYFDKSKLCYNYHEFDNRFKIDHSKRSSKITYLGNFVKTSLTKNDLKKYNINYVKSSLNNNLFKNIYNPSIHIDYLLNDNIYYHLHTSTKLSTALYFKAVFICNRIPIYVELLGNNYPLFFKNDLSDLYLIIKEATEIINDKNKYEEYNLKMIDVFNKLKPKTIYKKYCKIVNSINNK